MRRCGHWPNGWPANRNAFNNAGIGTTLPGGGKRQESEDGYELRFAVNYLAPFLLTRLLLPALRRSAPSRIVNVDNAGQAPINFRDVMLEHHYDGVQAYSQSKLALVMFTFDLAEELTGTGVTANCLHPATYMPTKMVLAARGSSVSTIEEGVQATMHLITAPELDQVSGRYYNGLPYKNSSAFAKMTVCAVLLHEKTICLLPGKRIVSDRARNAPLLHFNYRDTRKFMTQNTKGITTNDS